jgi:hypothetical protein
MKTRGPSSDIKILCELHEKGAVYGSDMGGGGLIYGDVLVMSRGQEIVSVPSQVV